MNGSAAAGSDLVLSLAHGHWMAAGLAAAVRHRCFDALAVGSATADQVAAHCEIPHAHAEMLLEALVGMQLVRCRGSRYENTETAASYLVSTSPDYLGSLVETLVFAGGIWNLWLDYDMTVAGARHVPDGFDPGVYRRALVNGIRPMTQRAASLAVAALGLDDRGRLRILDVGGGSGTFSEVMLSAVPGATALQVDGPKINAEAAARMRLLDCGDRFDTVDGTFPDVDFAGEVFDVVIYSAVAHLHAEAVNRANIRRCRDLLAPQGRLIIHDYLSHTDEADEPCRVTNLNWLLIGTGRVWPLGTVTDWLSAAELTCETTIDTGLWTTVVIAAPARR